MMAFHRWELLLLPSVSFKKEKNSNIFQIAQFNLIKGFFRIVCSCVLVFHGGSSRMKEDDLKLNYDSFIDLRFRCFGCWGL